MTAPKETAPVVAVTKVAKVASGVVFVVCAFALLVGLLTGFYMVYPPMDAVIGVIAAVFYYMGSTIEKQWRA